MSDPVVKPGAGKPSRRGAVISGVVTVAVLAAVIIGVAALGPSDSEQSPNIGLEEAPSADSAQLVQQGEVALAAGETTVAVALANQALKADPANQAARALLTKATAVSRSGSGSGSSGGGSSSGSGSGGATSGANPDEGFTKKVPDMGKLLPSALKDYFLGEAVVTPAEAQVSATPVKASQPARQITWTVRVAEDKSDAQRFIAKVSKQLYAQDGASVSVDGAPGYFGTDGTRYATYVYVRGRYVFEVLVAGNDRDPKGLRTLAQEAAKAFADTPSP